MLNLYSFSHTIVHCSGKDSSILPYTHILDLADFGFIKPHIDSPRVSFSESMSIKFTFLSSLVLRLDRGCAESALNLRGQVQAGQGQGPGNQQNNSISIEIQTDQHRIFQVVDAVIEQRSLYVMKVNN